jgi:ubiquinol-cytochrome c reductase iron-sulfur subunit
MFLSSVRRIGRTAALVKPTAISACNPVLARSSSTAFGSTDGGFDKDRIVKAPGDGNQREFTYFMLGGARFIYASTARLALIKFVASMSATADVLALASAEFDTGAIAEGTTLTVKWRGKPVFIRHRTDDEVAVEANVELSGLRDPQKDSDRYQDPKWLIVLGICTHLGCVPISGAGDYNGWFCPCHGSHYDTSGRIRKGPAPTNLELPPYTLDGTQLIVG